ncbi:hypothetical protein [uncultured Thiothrix sp.]|uniref:hypothetical protein n=1 Tax=uncultured Thiothrix sp. TaxID=223185 RepID=UPI002616C690|nr:hypothetical protein [uncultured Thiothrix sp.]HMT94279.1 hypothetical protein [Thiolinea sp.]
MDNKRDAESLKALTQGLNREAENLSLKIQGQLQQARQTALLDFNKQSGVKSYRWFTIWLGARRCLDTRPGAVFAGLVGAMVISLGLQLVFNHTVDNSLGSSEVSSKNSADVLMSNEDIEFLDNMDIYEWLAAEYS